jgi:hypothetical protein
VYCPFGLDNIERYDLFFSHSFVSTSKLILPRIIWNVEMLRYQYEFSSYIKFCYVLYSDSKRWWDLSNHISGHFNSHADLGNRITNFNCLYLNVIKRSNGCTCLDLVNFKCCLRLCTHFSCNNYGKIQRRRHLSVWRYWNLLR